MSEAKKKESIDCYGREKPSQNQLEMPLVVELVELYRLNRDIQVDSFLEYSLVFTWSIRKILVRLRALMVACTREKSQQ